MTAKEKLQEIIDLLSSSLEDSAKFDRGMDSPGIRVRGTASQASKKLKELRVLIQETRASRKE